MIIAVEDVRRMIETDIEDDELKFRLKALEMAIRSYTNNHFIVSGSQRKASIREGRIIISSSQFDTGDTLELFSLEYNGKLVVVNSIEPDSISVDERLRFECDVDVALVQYPDDVVVGVVNLLKWDMSNRDKIGIKSETISRWSVTYYDLETSSLLGYPTSLLGFTKNYMRARF